jgi:hypothetical protein
VTVVITVAAARAELVAVVIAPVAAVHCRTVMHDEHNIVYTIEA